MNIFIQKEAIARLICCDTEMKYVGLTRQKMLHDWSHAYICTHCNKTVVAANIFPCLEVEVSKEHPLKEI